MLKNKLYKIFLSGGMVKKFVTWIAFVIIFVGVLTTVFVQINLTNTLSEEFNTRGQIVSRNLASSSVEPLLIEDTVNLHRLVENIKKTEKDIRYVYVTDVKGKVLAHTFDGGFPSDLLASNPNTNGRYIDIGGVRVIEFTSPILDGRAGFVHVGMDETYLHEKIIQTRNFIITLTFVVGIVGVLMAYIVGSHLIRPIHALVKGAEEIGRGNLEYQIDTVSSDETHILSEAFNQMSYNLNNSISELRASEERYRKLVDGISDAVMLIDSQKKVLSWNKAAQAMFRWSSNEIVGKKISILYSHAVTDDKMIRDGEYIFLKKNGTIFPGILKNKPLKEGDDSGNVIAIRDISEHREKEQLERQLLQSEKLATLGQLAAGVAHEINNPLANISLYTQMLIRKTKNESVKDKLKTINDEANRAAHIVKGLLDFSRQSEPKLSPTDINKEIDKVLSILTPQLTNIRVTTELQPFPNIMADSEQIRQVLMNMLTNSIQAITTYGEIVVKTSANHDHIEISISDNGCGIHKENLGKIFDPFFTTKGTEGTGLGLSICYGIIKRHNGSIEVKSEVGKGTTFIIKLPM